MSSSRPSRPPPPPGRPPPPSDRHDIDKEDARHRREQADLRARRKASKAAKSESRLEKEQKQREHRQRVLQEKAKEQQQQRGGSKGRPGAGGKSDGGGAGGSSLFQALFSKRLEGFVIDLEFRNAPPRPPVGPCFVGLGIDGQLSDSWTRYKPHNAVESHYAWKLHTEPHLGVPLAPWAMDVEGYYMDPTKKKGPEGHNKRKATPSLHPDDEALLNWKGSWGDTAAEELHRRRERARAAARLQGVSAAAAAATTPAKAFAPSTPAMMAPSTAKLKRTAAATPSSSNKATPKVDFKSRVLDEEMQFFMKKTTYLTNDQTKSVHKFTSLAQTKQELEAKVTLELQSKTNKNPKEIIVSSFDACRADGASAGEPPRKKRRHPTKRQLEVLYEIPVLPDEATWDAIFTHLIMDNPPQSKQQQESQRRGEKGGAESATSATLLNQAFVTDVERSRSSSSEGAPRMVCNMLVPRVEDKDSSKASAPEVVYDACQRYDLEVVPLKEEDGPHTTFLLEIQEGVAATYHPISSRVSLTTGRAVPSRKAMGVAACRIQRRSAAGGAVAAKTTTSTAAAETTTTVTTTTKTTTANDEDEDEDEDEDKATAADEKEPPVDEKQTVADEKENEQDNQQEEE